MLTILQYLRYNFKLSISLISFVLSISTAIDVHSQIPEFKITQENKCAPSLVVFTNLSEFGPGKEFLWDFGKGAIISSNEEILTEAYTVAGTYIVTLSLVSGTDTTPSSQNLIVSIGPTANFTVSERAGCLPLSVGFADNSVAGDAAIEMYYWDLRNGSTRTASTFNYVYTNPGLNSLYLEVTDANGCSNYIEHTNIIEVFPKPVASFSAIDSFSCDAPVNISFINTSVGGNQPDYVWDFGNNTSSVEYSGNTSYTEEGSFDVQLIVNNINTCTDTLTKENYINIGSVAGSIIAITPDGPVYNDSAILCQGTTKISTTLPPQSDYSWEVNYNGSTSNYTNLASIDLELLDSGYVDIVLIYNSNTDCNDTLRQHYTVDFIEADFSMDKYYTCELPLNLGLTNESKNSEGIEWLFPDKSADTLSQSIYRIEKPKTYEATYRNNQNKFNLEFALVATNSNGCRDSLKKYLNVNLPRAQLVPDVSAGCAPLQVNFSDSSSSSESIVQWEYLVDGVNMGNTPGDFSHLVNSPGNFEFQLLITNSLGCVDTSYAVIIHTGEKINTDFSLSPTTICFGEVLSITNESVGDENIDSWQYHAEGLFNTGAISDDKPEIRVFPERTGTYSVSGTAEDNGCLSDTVFPNFIVVDGPTGNFSYTFSCDSSFKYTFIPELDDAETWTIEIEDSTYINRDTIVHRFASSGDYTVRLMAGNTLSGCSFEKIRTIPVRQVEAVFEIDPILCLGKTYLFNAENSIDPINNCHVESFYWNFGDNSPSRRSYQNFYEHSYTATGKYKPFLVLTGDNGCTDTSRIELEVVQPPADFSATPMEGCGPELEISFDYYSIDGTIDNFLWLYSDLTSDESNQAQVTHSFASDYSSIGSATLKVLDINGCANSSFVPINIKVPRALFQAVDPNLCLGETVAFILADTSIRSFEFDFGDGTPPSSTNSHTYLLPGTYDVSLSVTKDACSDFVLMENLISVELANANYTVSDSVSDCYPLSVNYVSESDSSVIASGTWTFLEGIQSQDFNSSVSYTYTKPGTHVSSLSIRTYNGCTASSSQIIEVEGPEAEFEFSPIEICNGDSASFNLLRTDVIDSYYWVFGDGNTSAEENPTHRYSASGDIYPAIHLVRGDCEVTLGGDTLHVSSIEADFVLQPEKDSYCINEPILGQNQSEEYIYSIWSLNNEIVSNSNHLSGVSFGEFGENKITLRISNLIPCYDTTSKVVQVVPLPEFAISGDTVICRDIETAQFSVDQPSPDWFIQWMPASLLDNPESFTPLAQAETDTTFTATLTDPYQCSSSENINVRVIQPGNVYRTPIGVTKVNIGESVQLYVNSENEKSSYSWSPNYNISCTGCNNPIVRPFESTTYSVLVNDECFETRIDFAIEVIIDYFMECPTAFSPNGDGENDLFYPEFGSIDEIDFKIFNRWGNLVFHSSDLDAKWDGTYKGNLQNVDTYTYYIKAKTLYNYEFEKKGTFLLMR